MAKKKKRPQGNPNAPKQRYAEMVQETFRCSTRRLNQKKFSNPQTKAALDFDPIRIKRRSAAVLSTIEEVRERVVSRHPQLRESCENFSVESDWVQINAHLLPAYDSEEAYYTVSLGAAIWMLDRLKECGQLYQAISLFPSDDTVLVDIDMPDVWDPCHSEEMLRGMMAILQGRNADCIGKRRDPAVLQNEALVNRVFMDLHTAENTHRQEVPSRVRFESVLNLIPMEAKEKAAAAFTDKFWEWVDRYYQCRGIYAAQEIQIEKEFKDFVASTKQEAEAITRKRKSKEPVSPMLPPPLEIPDNIPAPPHSLLASGVHADIARLTAQLETESNRLEAWSKQIDDSVSDLWYYLRYQGSRSYEDSVKNLGKEAADIWEDFTIEDPYALCFGFLYLLDSGSDLPWLYYPGVNLFAWSGSYLPWNGCGYDEEDDPYWDLGDDPDARDMHGAPSVRLPKRIKIPDMENWYRLDYLNRNEDPEYRTKRNLAQIVFDITGGIMPRRLDRYLPALEELDDYGINGKKAAHPLLYCMALLGESRRQSRDWRQGPEDLQQDSGDADDRSPEALQAKAGRLQQEVDQLRHALHEAGREAREAKKRQEAADRKSAMERQELADLRELVFHQQEGVYADETPSEEIRFPCHTTRRIVVFGGHDSWAREIKPKLPDVRFVDRTVIPNAQLIRNADVIWIQTNALSHAYYYKIIEEVRKYDIPVRYFSYASAAKCAEQIVQQDMG